jgi:hypothetical protein
MCLPCFVSTNVPLWPPFRAPLLVGLGLLWLLHGVTGLPALLASPPAPQSSRPPALVKEEATPTFRDLELTLQARAALLKEGAFSALNVGVSVRQRVATLFGTLPSLELARRAEELIQQIPGLIEVRNDLQVDRSDQPRTRSFALPSLDRAGSTESSALSGPFQAPAALVRRPTEHGPAPAQELPWRPGKSSRSILTTLPTTDLPGSASRLAGPDRLASPPQPNSEVSWRPQRTAGNHSATASAGSKPAAVLLPPVRLEPSVPVAEAVEALRQREERFRPIRSDVQGARVYLHGSVIRWEDLFAFAKSISLLPGVEQVILQDIHAGVPKGK